MRICCDTSFLLAVIEDKPEAMRRLDRARHGYDVLVVPKITLAELLVVLLRRDKSSHFDRIFRELGAYADIKEMTDEIIRLSAKLVHTCGVSLVDSIIFATGEAAGCRLILSKDRDMKRLERTGICSMEVKGFGA